MAEANPELLTLVREYRGLTQSTLAERAGLTQGYVSKFEHGLIDAPTRESIAKLARALDWPEDFFLRPERRYGFGTTCLFHRKRASLQPTQLRKIEATVNVVRLGIEPLLREIALGDVEFPVLDVDLFDSPERIAQLVRGQWRLPMGPITNLTTVIEAAGAIVFHIDFETRLLDAVSHWSPDSPPMFFANTHSSGERLRYSLAHEIGHIVMHSASTATMEAEADRFAAELLMPAREIKAQLINLDLVKAAKLKPYWRVSIQALVRRAQDLETISRNRASSLFRRMNAMGYKVNEPLPLEREEPTVLRKLLDVHRMQHGYSTEDLIRSTEIGEDAARHTLVTDRPRLVAVK